MASTFGPRVCSRHGAFAGLFRLDYDEALLRRDYRRPVLAACADGVGTKVLLGIQTGRLSGLGIDLVAMNINDLLTVGAEPLFFLDYLAAHKLDPVVLAEIIEGVAAGCRQAGCALLGGETAEMPDVYAKGNFDLAGFAVGVVGVVAGVVSSLAQAVSKMLDNSTNVTRIYITFFMLLSYKDFCSTKPMQSCQTLNLTPCYYLLMFTPALAA